MTRIAPMAGASLLLLLLASLLLRVTDAWIPSPSPRPASSAGRTAVGGGAATTRLFSTLAPTQTGIGRLSDDDDDSEKERADLKGGGISMSVSDLSKRIGGLGRARIAWDCYSIGVDPANFYDSVIRLGHDDFETIYDLLPTSRRSQALGKDALDRLSQLYPTSGGRVEGGVASLSHVSQAQDKTTKMLLRLSDGLEVETVIIPWNGIRSTLCISSQVGCRQGCKFCATGKMGKLRSLTSDEILAQMFFARKICRLNSLPPVTNAVFMGMGEPADNADAVRTAVEILTKRELFQLSSQKVTVSTVAPTPDSFGQFADSPCVLAWSVHAADDELRRKLVPTTRYRMEELRQGLIDALNRKPRHMRATMLEVALLAGVNDSERRADELAEFAHGIVDAVPGCKLVVNLIPYNEVSGGTGEQESLYRKPSHEAVVYFQKRLWSQGIYAHIRTTRGDDATAACGQLATNRSKQRDAMQQLQVNGTIPGEGHLQ